MRSVSLATFLAFRADVRLPSLLTRDITIRMSRGMSSRFQLPPTKRRRASTPTTLDLVKDEPQQDGEHNTVSDLQP